MSAVRDWLEEIGLAQYADAFEANDIDTDLLLQIDDQVLKGGDEAGRRSRICQRHSSDDGERTIRQEPAVRPALSGTPICGSATASRACWRRRSPLAMAAFAASAIRLSGTPATCSPNQDEFQSSHSIISSAYAKRGRISVTERLGGIQKSSQMRWSGGSRRR
jgi:hypothetical protein